MLQNLEKRHYLKETKVIVLDLDQTLINSWLMRREPDATNLQSFKIPENWLQCYTFVRPHLKEFLEYLQEHYIVGFWTYAENDYARAILRNILPEGYNYKFVWSKKDCVHEGNKWYKPLSKLCERYGWELENVHMIDDSPHVAELNPDNLINIRAWVGSENDDEFYRIMELLDERDGRYIE